MSNYLSETSKACVGNPNGFLYALIEMKNKKSKGDPFFDWSDDVKYHLNNDISYIGITNNPIKRYSDHTMDCNKGKKIGMIIFDTAETPYEGKKKEGDAIYDYCLAFGQGPKFQKGHDTWAGA